MPLLNKLGYPGGSVVKNLPASAGDMGLILDAGRSRMPWSNEARVWQLLSLCSRDPALPVCPRAGAPQEKPQQ